MIPDVRGQKDGKISEVDDLPTETPATVVTPSPSIQQLRDGTITEWAWKMMWSVGTVRKQWTRMDSNVHFPILLHWWMNKNHGEMTFYLTNLMMVTATSTGSSIESVMPYGSGARIVNYPMVTLRRRTMCFTLSCAAKRLSMTGSASSKLSVHSTLVD